MYVGISQKIEYFSAVMAIFFVKNVWENLKLKPALFVGMNLENSLAEI